MTTEEDASTSYIPHNELDDINWLSASVEETELLEVAVWGQTKPPSFEKTPLLLSMLRRLHALHYQVDVMAIPIKVLAKYNEFPPFTIH